MTSSGKRLASLSGVPDFNLTLWYVSTVANSVCWQSIQHISIELQCIYLLAPSECRDLDAGCELCRTSVGPGRRQVSFNPLNWKQMCVLGQDYLTLYSVEQCDDDQFMLTPQ